jgi:ketosteroid isomerase-like protein
MDSFSNNKKLEIIRQYITLRKNKDVAQAMDLLTDDIVFVSLRDGTFEGHKAVNEYFDNAAKKKLGPDVKNEAPEIDPTTGNVYVKASVKILFVTMHVKQVFIFHPDNGKIQRIETRKA